MMVELIQVLSFPALLVALAVAAQLFGADSRDGRDWQPPDVLRQPRAHV
jgi:hypothetical protein